MEKIITIGNLIYLLFIVYTIVCWVLNVVFLILAIKGDAFIQEGLFNLFGILAFPLAGVFVYF